MKRRLIPAALLISLATLAAPVFAQDFKGKTVYMVVPAPSGSAPDVIARLVSEAMRGKLGATIVVENRPGAGGIIAVNQVKGAVRDGTRLLFAQGSTVAITPLTYKEAQFDVARDFETIAAIAETPMLMASNPRTGPASLAAALAAAKAKPDTLTMANAGVNSIPHLTAEMMDQISGTRFRQVPMGTSGQAIQAVVNGDIDIFIDGVASLTPMIAAGRMKALAVTSAKELPGLEGVPLAKDTVPGLVVSGWFALFAPKGTPAALVVQLNEAANVAVQDPQVIAKMRVQGTYPLGGTVADAQAFVNTERAKWAAVIQKSGIKPQ